MDQTVIIAIGNEIQVDELIFPIGLSDNHSPVKSLANMERGHILRVLKECSGNKTKAAKVLGLARSTLLLKLKEYNEGKKPESE
jgi:two-component system response regulator HydG